MFIVGVDITPTEIGGEDTHDVVPGTSLQCGCKELSAPCDRGDRNAGADAAVRNSKFHGKLV